MCNPTSNTWVHSLGFCFIFLFFMFFNDFIYLWLCKVFMLHGLSLAAASRDCSPVGAMGFSQRWLLLLQSMDSGAQRPQYCSSPAPEPRPRGCDTGLSCSATWSLPRPGVELASTALAGGLFFTTEPPGKPSGVF